jgi:hypothetical protein
MSNPLPTTQEESKVYFTAILKALLELPSIVPGDTEEVGIKCPNAYKVRTAAQARRALRNSGAATAPKVPRAMSKPRRMVAAMQKAGPIPDTFAVHIGDEFVAEFDSKRFQGRQFCVLYKGEHISHDDFRKLGGTQPRNMHQAWHKVIRVVEPDWDLGRYLGVYGVDYKFRGRQGVSSRREQ